MNAHDGFECLISSHNIIFKSKRHSRIVLIVFDLLFSEASLLDVVIYSVMKTRELSRVFSAPEIPNSIQISIGVSPLFPCIQRRSHSIITTIKQMDFSSKSYKCIWRWYTKLMIIFRVRLFLHFTWPLHRTFSKQFHFPMLFVSVWCSYIRMCGWFNLHSLGDMCVPTFHVLYGIFLCCDV